MTIPHRTSKPLFSMVFFFTPFNHRDGTCVRDYLHIMDLASGHVLALEALTPESQIFDPNSPAFFKAYNLGKGRGVSVLQIVEAMRRATGFDYKYEIIGRRWELSNFDSTISYADVFCQTRRCS